MFQPHSLLDDFNRLRRMKDAQARGYRLQEFVGTLFTKRHFDVRLNSRAARPRQTDLVARKGNDVYVVEAKWQGSSTDIDDLTSLRDRLERTAGLAIGIFISMAPYTDNVIAEVEHRRKQPLLLISRDEFVGCLEYDEDIERLVTEKRELLLLEGRAFDKTPKGGGQRSRGTLPKAAVRFVLNDGSDAPYLALKGDYDQAVFALRTFDIDWVTSSGAGITYDVSFPLSSEDHLVDLLRYLAQVDWVTANGQWAIEQAGVTWHGIGARTLVDALKHRQQRYKSLARVHHTEVVCYHDICESGFYTLRVDIEVGGRASRISTCDASFQLIGVPLDTSPFRQMNARFGVRKTTYFRPRVKDSNEGGFVRDRAPLKAVAKIVYHDARERAGEQDWVIGLVVKNPYKGRRDDQSQDWPQLLNTAETLICRLGHWHYLHDRVTYRLRRLEWAWTSDVSVISPSADWDDKRRRGQVIRLRSQPTVAAATRH